MLMIELRILYPIKSRPTRRATRLCGVYSERTCLCASARYTRSRWSTRNTG